MLKKFNVRRRCTVPRPLTLGSIKKFDGTKKLMMTSSVDGCSILLENQLVWTCLHVYSTQVSSAGGSLPPMGAAGEMPESNTKPPL